MRAEYFAALTAVCWSVGSLFEKKGVKLGGLAPVMGVGVRTAVSLVLLAAFSYPYWGQLRTAGAKSLLLVAFGGGVLAGAVGVVCLYAGLKTGNLSTVMTIAFCSTPVFGAVLGVAVLKEKLSLLQVLGIVMCVGGAALTVLCKRPA